jgi:hypothetical protein
VTEEIAMGTLTGFFDTAGHPTGHHALIVCGHVSEARKGTKFETQWKAALADAGIRGPFHMTEFMACVKSFDGWRARIDDRAQFSRTLIGIIKRNVYKAFSETILLDDWRAVDKRYQLDASHCTPFCTGVVLRHGSDDSMVGPQAPERLDDGLRVRGRGQEQGRFHVDDGPDCAP